MVDLAKSTAGLFFREADMLNFRDLFEHIMGDGGSASSASKQLDEKITHCSKQHNTNIMKYETPNELYTVIEVE